MDTYISLEAAKGIIRERGVLGEGYSWEEREEDVCDMLDCVAIADVAPIRRGKWENIERIGFTSFEATCSACGRRMLYTPIHLYCPNCGAKMKGAE